MSVSLSAIEIATAYLLTNRYFLSIRKIHTSLFFLIKLDAAIREPKAVPSVLYFNIGQGSRIYVKILASDQPFIAGLLFSIQIDEVPFWIFQPSSRHNSK